jgi:hypothetical protein
MNKILLDIAFPVVAFGLLYLVFYYVLNYSFRNHVKSIYRKLDKAQKLFEKELNKLKEDLD